MDSYGRISAGLAIIGNGRRTDRIWWLLLQWLIAFSALVVLTPFMLLVAAIIAATDGAPVLFAHARVGRGGRVFRCLKFRTMRVDAEAQLRKLIASDQSARREWEQFRKLSRDPRITPIGHFLRKTSLDELPQLFNVLLCEMTLVGPRPITVDELAR